MLRIQRRTSDATVIFELCGQIGVEHLAELQCLISEEPAGQRVVLDLTDLRLVDREAVAFLADWEARGIELENCPAYVREWVVRERAARPT